MDVAIALVTLKCSNLQNEIKNLTSDIDSLERQVKQKVDRKKYLVENYKTENNLKAQLLNVKKLLLIKNK